VCLLYQFTEEYLLDPKNRIIGAIELTYGTNPLSDWFVEQMPDKVEDSFYDDFTAELLKQVLIKPFLIIIRVYTEW